MLNQVLRTYRLSKKINGYTVLDGLSLDLFANEILTVTGAPNSGKELLPLIFSGAVLADSGKIYLSEKEVSLSSQKSAQDKGIFTVEKIPRLMDKLSVAENIFIASGQTKSLFYHREKAVSFTCRLFAEFQIPIDPRLSVKKLSLFEKHLMEFLSAYVRGAKIMVADHITGFYSDPEILLLFSLLQRFREKGLSILLIDRYSARLAAVSDRIMVMKNGKHMGSFYREEITEGLIKELIGEEDELPDFLPRIWEKPEKELCVDHITGSALKHALTFTAQKGEIVGFYSAEYTQLSGIMDTLSGESRILSGKITLCQKNIRFKNRHQAFRAGIWLLPHNWAAATQFLNMTVDDNVCMMNLGRVSRLGFLNRRLKSYAVQEILRTAGLPERYASLKIQKLSPEEQQKLLMAKLLHGRRKVLMLDEPFLYNDITRKQDVGRFLSEISSQGTIVLIFSTNIQKLSDFCNRIYMCGEVEKKR